MGILSICTNAMTRVLATAVCTAARHGTTCETGSPMLDSSSRCAGLFGSPSGLMAPSVEVIFTPRKTPAAKRPAIQG